MGIMAQGGMISVVGGNVESLVAANDQKKRARFEIDPTALNPSAKGSIFASHTITNARSLQNRYNEANQMAECDRRVRLAWMNLCRQRLGWPPRKAWSPGLRTGNFITK
jgi:hypothetical protein